MYYVPAKSKKIGKKTQAILESKYGLVKLGT